MNHNIFRRIYLKKEPDVQNISEIIKSMYIEGQAGITDIDIYVCVCVFISILFLFNMR